MQLDTCGNIQPSKSLFLELKKTSSGHSCDNITRRGSRAFEVLFWNSTYKYPLHEGHLRLQLCWQKTQCFPVIPRLLALKVAVVYFITIEPCPSNRKAAIYRWNQGLFAHSVHTNIRIIIWEFEVRTIKGDRMVNGGILKAGNNSQDFLWQLPHFMEGKMGAQEY